MSNKTILLVIGFGFSARYLLRSDFFEELKSSGNKIVILSPSADEKAFREEFRAGNVFFELYNTQGYDSQGWVKKASKIRLFFTLLRTFSFKGRHKNNFTEYWRENYFTKKKNSSILARSICWLFRLLIYLNSNSELFRKLMLLLEKFTLNSVHQSVFDKHKPDLTIVTSLGNLHYDHFAMAEAKRNKSKILSVILSWDNTTTKGTAGGAADYVVAWTDTMKQELLSYHDLREDDVYVSGVAQYDTYFKPLKEYKKLDVYQEYGLDPVKKTIFYCLESPTAYVWNADLIKLIAEQIENYSFSEECQLLVRLHPIYYRINNGRLAFEKEIEELKQLGKEYPFVHFDYPKTISQKMSFDMPSSEITKLGQFLGVSDVVICFYSSMMLEASIYDVPVVNISLYPKNEIPNDVIKNHAHIKRILATGGVRTVHDEAALIGAINMYLDDPGIDRSARATLVENEAGPNRGEGGKAIAAHVFRLLADSKIQSDIKQDLNFDESDGNQKCLM